MEIRHFKVILNTFFKICLLVPFLAYLFTTIGIVFGMVAENYPSTRQYVVVLARFLPLMGTGFSIWIILSIILDVFELEEKDRIKFKTKYGEVVSFSAKVPSKIKSWFR